ncbi:ABC transporter substrate-binding protein [Sporichthya polymorpha]|uniref:ABC transporter substrate-binding protein n=1 Tax=Sporichthya polymorpha TaxID=35751 RepID=UPI00037DE2BC|nr:ABC transporter substrate-binding protein [Sporichthya polymorpha]
MPRANRSIRRVGAVLVAVGLLAGCGTRVAEDRIERASGLGGEPVATAASIAPASEAAGSASTADLAAPGAAVPVTADQKVIASGPVKAADRTEGASERREGAPGPAAPTGCTKPLAPVVLGQTAPASGIIGAATANARSGLVLWARVVNARGGLACHPVQLHQMDDAADPVRVTSNLTTLVKDKGAVAIVAAYVPTTFSAARQFAERTRIPFVGGDLIEPGWFASPYLFPQGGTPFAAYAGAIKEAAAATGGSKVGLLYCVEAGACGQINENFEAMVKAAGLEFTLRKVTSITAPDYTAECQAMKSAGVEVLFMAMEGASDSRAARSCRALGYEPAVAVGAISVSEAVSNDPNLRAMGLYLGTGNAPFTATDSAGVRAFRAAYDTYAPGSSIDQNTIYGWAAGKLLEAAIATVAAKAAAGAITTALILDGLGQVAGETLDGLAPGITFSKGAPPKLSDCYYSLTITDRGYGSPRGSKVTCLRGLPKGF